MKSLYLRIYLTVVAFLAAFALVAGWMAQRHIEGERIRTQAAWAERASAWAVLLQNSLPDTAAPEEEQSSALLAWSHRLRLPLALDNKQGKRIAASPQIEPLLAQRGEDGELPQGLARMQLTDGRVLWMARRQPPGANIGGGIGPRVRIEGRDDRGGPPGDRPPFMQRDRDGPPGPGMGPMNGPPWFMAPPWALGGSGLIVTLLVLFFAIAAGAYPVVRRLTRRLESLQRGVSRFGAGELGHRVEVDGNDEVAAVAGSFNVAAQRIEELVRAHRSLLANASHELRSPLARLKMALELMEGASPQRRTELREEIERDIRELDELVEEVLLASRLDAQTPQEHTVVDLLGVAAEEASRAGARLELADSAQATNALLLNGNERLLRRALRNLLENARRYGLPAGRDADEVLELHAAREGKDIVLRMCDRGPGVPAGMHERIFEPFYRLPGHAERAGGVGLGLSLVRQIAQHHGGTVHYEDRPGGGSCFIFRVPGGS
jgi:signal transduction histidine kinase